MSHDYSDYTDKPASEDALAELSRLADQQMDKAVEVEKAEAELKRVTDEYRQIAEVDIPELMQELGLEEFKTTSGLIITIKEAVRASILAAQKAAAFRWLRENGHGALIKRVVKLQFGMGDDELAQAAIDKLGDDYDIDDDSSVHAGTLKKFVKEMQAEGKEVPETMFSIHRQRVAGIKTKK